LSAKQQVLEAIRVLPEDASVEDALNRVHLLYKIERGMRQADEGQLISHKEVGQRMARWLK